MVVFPVSATPLLSQYFSKSVAFICSPLSLFFSSYTPLLSQSHFHFIVTICLSIALSPLRSICRTPLCIAAVFSSSLSVLTSFLLFLSLPSSHRQLLRAEASICSMFAGNGPLVCCVQGNKTNQAGSPSAMSANRDNFLWFGEQRRFRNSGHVAQSSTDKWSSLSDAIKWIYVQKGQGLLRLNRLPKISINRTQMLVKSLRLQSSLYLYLPFLTLHLHDTPCKLEQNRFTAELKILLAWTVNTLATWMFTYFTYKTAWRQMDGWQTCVVDLQAC